MRNEKRVIIMSFFMSSTHYVKFIYFAKESARNNFGIIEIWQKISKVNYLTKLLRNLRHL